MRSTSVPHPVPVLAPTGTDTDGEVGLITDGHPSGGESLTFAKASNPRTPRAQPPMQQIERTLPELRHGRPLLVTHERGADGHPLHVTLQGTVSGARG